MIIRINLLGNTPTGFIADNHNIIYSPSELFTSLIASSKVYEL